MRAHILFSLCLTLGFAAACAKAPEQRTFTLQGQIQSLEPARKLVTIKHEEIKGFMPAMTMPYKLRDPTLARIGAAHGCSAAAVALAWTIRSGKVIDYHHSKYSNVKFLKEHRAVRSEGRAVIRRRGDVTAIDKHHLKGPVSEAIGHDAD